ncbi:hypothetical protein O181_116460 [Austropuccinia psidii MF-1]|uniref:Uncharacterized protein n=1 Tax=Austropuccinia psidii MF-1 TaxID=1389203 RepID=A0A9Q3KCG3_9BASI|nr:hypothetical protein [Austropuccinia psidii MF-1]
MQLTSDMAAVFFLHSLDNDNELSSLCQKIYDLKPFYLNTITDRVAVEHTRRQSEGATILMAAKSKKEGTKEPQGQENQPKGHKFKENKEKKPRFQYKVQHSNSNDAIKRIENLEKMMEKIHLTLKISSLNMADSQKPETENQSNLDAFMVEYVHSIGTKNNKEGIIYLDSGAGQTVVNSLSLLSNPVRVDKQMNTFSSPVKITHKGTFNFKGVNLHPVFYVPNGPVSLLSVSQLCDHGLKISTKSNMMLIKQQD